MYKCDKLKTLYIIISEITFVTANFAIIFDF